MSIWDVGLGYDASWPEWFKEYRRQEDAEMRAQIAAVQRGELTAESYYEQASEDADRHRRWRDSLPPDRRAWLEAAEAEDRANRTFVVPEEIARLIPRVDMRAIDGASDPVREYLRLQQEALASAPPEVREWFRNRRTKRNAD